MTKYDASLSDYYSEVCRIARDISGCRKCTADWDVCKRDYNRNKTAFQSAQLFAKAWNPAQPGKQKNE